MLKKKLGAEGIERDWSRNRKTVANYFKTCRVEFNSVLFDDFTSAYHNVRSIKLTIREVIITGTKPLPDFVFLAVSNLERQFFETV